MLEVGFTGMLSVFKMKNLWDILKCLKSFNNFWKKIIHLEHYGEGCSPNRKTDVQAINIHQLIICWKHVLCAIIYCVDIFIK